MSRKYTFEPVKTITGTRLAYCINDNLPLFKYECYDDLVRVCINEGHIVSRDKFPYLYYKRFDIMINDIISYGLYNELITKVPNTFKYKFSDEIIQCANRWKEMTFKHVEIGASYE